MATEPQKICPPTPRKEARRYDVPIMPRFVVTSFVGDCIGKISPNNPCQIITESEISDKKAINIQNTAFVIHMGEALDQCADRSYQANISQNGHVILTDCRLKTKRITPSIANCYDPKTSIDRVHTFSVTNRDGVRIDFTKPVTNEDKTAVKRIKVTNAAGLQWREKTVPLSLMFNQPQANSTPSDQTQLNTPKLN